VGRTFIDDVAAEPITGWAIHHSIPASIWVVCGKRSYECLEPLPVYKDIFKDTMWKTLLLSGVKRAKSGG
jgi:hypothetical protein